MARRSREDVPGSWHHVVNRGIAKRPLFERREDMRFFLARLVRQVRRGRIEVHAYCLMTTHFHILARSPIGQLAEALRRTQNEHSRRFNREHRRDGPLIRGRFFSRPVDSLRYRRVLVSYIDTNPVRAGMAGRVGEYEYCSARAYERQRGSPWLSRDWIESEIAASCPANSQPWIEYLKTFHTNDPAAMTELHELVELRLSSTAEGDSLGDLVSTAPEHVRAWMDRKTALADGHKPGLPVCARSTLRAALDASIEREGGWFVEDGERIRKGEELAWVGLLRSICGLTWEEMSGIVQGSSSKLSRLGAIHERLVRQDVRHRERSLEVARTALARVFPG